MIDHPRERATRIADTLLRLEHDVDLWVATAGADGGEPFLVPLSFEWDGETLLLSTSQGSPTGRNLAATGVARVALGGLRDVVLVEATATEHALDEVAQDRWEAYAERTGWDPRESGPGYAAYLLRPVRIQAWREVEEMAGRELMREGRWR